MLLLTMILSLDGLVNDKKNAQSILFEMSFLSTFIFSRLHFPIYFVPTDAFTNIKQPAEFLADFCFFRENIFYSLFKFRSLKMMGTACLAVFGTNDIDRSDRSSPFPKYL